MPANNPCFIVAGGPSLKGFDWSLLTGKFTIAVNRAFEQIPDADIIYFTDNKVWVEHGEAMVKHPGKLVRGVQWGESHKNRIRHGVPECVELYHLSSPTGINRNKGQLSHGHNSPYAAMNMAAAHLHKNPIYLLGVDMGVHGGQWYHDGYKKKPRNTSPFPTMIAAYKSAVEPLKQMGVEVINLSLSSALDCFPKVDPMEVLCPKVLA